jgi:hypothetical protein
MKLRVSYDLVRSYGFIPDSRVKTLDLSYCLAGVNRYGQASKAVLTIQGPCVETIQSKAYWYQQSGYDRNIDKREVRTLQFLSDEGTMNADVINTEAASPQGSDMAFYIALCLVQQRRRAIPYKS